MCLSIPAIITKIVDVDTAIVSINDLQIEIATSLIDNPQKGDYVLVHTGFALQKIDQDDAEVLIIEIQKLNDTKDELD